MRNYLKKPDIESGLAPGGSRRPGPFKRLWRNKQGSIYALAAFLALPLIGLVGIGADTAKLYLAKAKFSQALDAAALATAKSKVSDQSVASIFSRISSGVRSQVISQREGGTAETT